MRRFPYACRSIASACTKPRIEDRWSEAKAAHEARVAATQSLEPLPRFDFPTDEIIRAIHDGRKGG